MTTTQWHPSPAAVTRRRRRGLAALAAGALALAPPPLPAQAPPGDGPARVIPDDTLRDLARTVFEHGRPTIYYNPALMARVGPRLARFFMAHEYGHVAMRHESGALAAGDSGFPAFRQGEELEADCYAAERLGPADAVRAAVVFFRQMGSFRFDDLHPTGHRRADAVLACADIAAPEPRPAPVAFTVGMPDEPLDGRGCEGDLWIDGVPIGSLSTLRRVAGRLTVRGFAAGAHRYSVTTRFYALDHGQQIIPAGQSSGAGAIDVGAGDELALVCRQGARPELLPAARASGPR